MPYPYGTQSLPAGVLAPGLPRRASGALNADPIGFPAAFVIVRTNQSVPIPSWATYARMGATGKGGDGASVAASTNNGGGGGGGFAGTNTVKAVPGAAINVRFDSTGTVVEGLGYRLIGGIGGNGTSTAAGVGGIGSGGDINFNGGNGVAPGANGTGAGGGAAGRGGNGSTAQVTNGGTGANGTDHISGSSGGANGGVAGGAAGSPGAVGTSPTQTIGSAQIAVGFPGTGASGGDGGGGGPGTQSFGPIAGGPGFALIEFW